MKSYEVKVETTSISDLVSVMKLCWIFIKFRKGILYNNWPSKSEFHENHHSDSHTYGHH